MDERKMQLALQNIEQAIATAAPDSDKRALLELMRQIVEALLAMR